MDPDADLASVASLIADRNRAQMLLTLLGGTPQSGSALAEAAGISRALASAHLKKLVSGRLLVARPQGRQQMYSIASESVADALEVLTLLAPPVAVKSLRDSTRARSLRWARLCYDHLGGTVAVAIVDSLIARDLIREHDGGYLLAPGGPASFRDLGVDVTLPQRGSRPLLRPCMDWTERRYHLAGSVGAAMTSEFLSLGWLAGREASRIVAVTESGRAGLLAWLGLDLTQLRPAA